MSLYIFFYILWIVLKKLTLLQILFFWGGGGGQGQCIYLWGEGKGAEIHVYVSRISILYIFNRNMLTENALTACIIQQYCCKYHYIL